MCQLRVKGAAAEVPAAFAAVTFAVPAAPAGTTAMIVSPT